MAKKNTTTIDGNEATASVAHRINDVIAIYPITPSSGMGEMADEWSSKGQRNIWGTIPSVTEMQSEAGAAGAVHGALQAGALSTTFTASQGLLLMIPNMYKIAGELTAYCMHVTARTVATHALSIFGDHSDVMACRQIGFGLLSSGSVQEAHDFACLGQAASLESRVPFLHFFDGFRTSHEVASIEKLSDDDLRHMIDDDLVQAHRDRAMTPDRPVLRGTAQNPDAFFQAREACNPYYDACPAAVEKVMNKFAARTGRQYHLFDYIGDPQAERVIMLMGSGAQPAQETAEYLAGKGERVGVVTVRLYRPFSPEHLLKALPKCVKAIAVLDRTKEPGAHGEPLFLDVMTAVHEAAQIGTSPLDSMPQIIGGRYGLSSKDFTPAMVKAVFDELAKDKPKRRFTVGIEDDVTHLSLPVDESFDIEGDDVVRGVFFGLGADGTVGANKNSIKIIGEETDNFAQGYFVYDSKKSGAMTISHLRFGPRLIRAPYLIKRANFVACHMFTFLERFEVLEYAAPKAVFLLTSPYGPDEVWDHLPREVQQQIIEKQLKFYVIDAHAVAKDTGMGGRINTIMQTCFFAISGVLPRDEAIDKIKESIKKTYSMKGDEVVNRNWKAVDETLAHLHEVAVPAEVTSKFSRSGVVADEAPDFVKNVTAAMMSGKGDLLPVSAFSPDGTWPTGTCKWEKRNIALEIPMWDPSVCVQCNKCALVCPHAAIRAKVYDPELLSGAPASFRSVDYRTKEFRGMKFTIQVAAEDCTGCALCVQACPAKDKSNPRHKAINMEPQLPLREQESENYAFFLNLPATPYTVNRDGRGPTWSNSLFEDAAEFGFGFRLAVDAQKDQAGDLLRVLASQIGDALVKELLEADQTGEAGIKAQRERVAALRGKLAGIDSPEAKRLSRLADYLVKKSVWSLGGDGWAYDIGYGGLDHVMSMRRDMNILVLDTEVYSNTGGQASKATPLGAAAKFAAAGKETNKKDLGLMAMSYGHVYVASIALGAKDQHTVRAFLEADAYPGPSLIIAYSHCIAHGYDLKYGLDQQKRAVECGIWPLYRYDPRRLLEGEPPLVLDAPAGKMPVHEYTDHETRFRMVAKIDKARFDHLAVEAQKATARRIATYEHLAKLRLPSGGNGNGDK